MALSDILANKALEEAKNESQKIEGQKQIANAEISFTNSIEKSKDSIASAKLTQEELTALINASGQPWPQTQINPEYNKTQGFLPPQLLPPNKSMQNENAVVKNKYLNYEFKDWKGQEIKPQQYQSTPISKFQKSKKYTKKDGDFSTSQYSMRDVPLIFGDTRLDYFRYGLQTLYDMGTVENPTNGKSDLRLSQFKETPYELNDPVMFGFDIIFEAGSSPLLNGSVLDFLNQYQSVNELSSKIPVYEEFKNQFIKFFRTDQNLPIDSNKITMTGTTNKVPFVDSNTTISEPGKKAYMSYYLKKVGGLELLSEANKGDTMKYLPEWKKDFITLDFNEDVTLNIGTLIHLYKLLYWSKPNGKMLVPENLLRFNCQIIISECRNFNRVRKNVATGNLDIIKDNLSRWVYSLKECQFYFDKIPHGNDVDLGGQGPDIFANHQLQFDFKYATTKLERFVPTGTNTFGTYVGYDGGAIWKIGTPGARETRNTGSGGDSSIPKFFTSGFTPPGQNGVSSPFVINVISGYNQPRTDGEPIDIFAQASKQNSDAISQLSQDKTDSSNGEKSSGKLTSILSDLNIKKAKDAFNDITGLGTKTIFSAAASKVTPFFNKNKDGNSTNKVAEIRKQLLNDSISKAYASQTNPDKGKFNIGDKFPNSTAFFDKKGDLKNQVKNFGGGPLGDNLFGG